MLTASSANVQELQVPTVDVPIELEDTREAMESEREAKAV